MILIHSNKNCCCHNQSMEVKQGLWERQYPSFDKCVYLEKNKLELVTFTKMFSIFLSKMNVQKCRRNNSSFARVRASFIFCSVWFLQLARQKDKHKLEDFTGNARFSKHAVSALDKHLWATLNIKSNTESQHSQFQHRPPFAVPRLKQRIF